MIIKILQISFLSLAFSSPGLFLLAEDQRTQYPSFLCNSYLNINVGSINYSFSNSQLEAGFQAESVHIPNLGMRLILGHEWNQYVSAQISYMKPFHQVVYRNINGVQSTHTVWMHAGTFSLRSRLPLKRNFSIYGEGGLGIITRKGFEINHSTVVKNASYATFSIGGGLQYQLNTHWDLLAGTVYLPANEKIRQPHTLSFSGGVQYTLRPLPAKRVEENSNSQFIFPRNLVQVGYTTNAFGYGVNNILSKGIFWGGMAEVAKGVWMRYQRNLFHTRKFFSIDGGTGFGYWKSKMNADEFYTVSAFPLFRFTALHTKPMDLYFHYSIAGPSFISKVDIDGNNTGNHFTFQDFTGIGVFIGKNRRLNAEIDLNHYSNGNIFPNNAAVKIPLSFSLGYTF